METMAIAIAIMEVMVVIKGICHMIQPTSQEAPPIWSIVMAMVVGCNNLPMPICRLWPRDIMVMVMDMVMVAATKIATVRARSSTGLSRIWMINGESKLCVLGSYFGYMEHKGLLPK